MSPFCKEQPGVARTFVLELSTLKVILTRMARDSRVIFCGDLTQVDNPYISPFGGMAALIEKFKGSHLFGL